jgi:hypothetical protein
MHAHYTCPVTEFVWQVIFVPKNEIEE